MTQKTIAYAYLLAAAMSSLAAEPLPHGVRMVSHTDGTYDYTITGVFTNGSAADTRSIADIDVNGIYKASIPNCTTASLSLATREMHFQTSAPISNLCSVVNELARMGGDLPYWEELGARDRRSTTFHDSLYRIVSTTTNGAAEADMNLRWEGVSRDQSVSVRLRYDTGKTGTLRFNRSTAFCMACNRFAMRLLDDKGQCIWEDVENVYADAQVAITDKNNDAVDEIVIHRNDHGFIIHTLTWARNLQQGAAPLPSATVGPSEGAR